MPTRCRVRTLGVLLLGCALQPLAWAEVPGLDLSAAWQQARQVSGSLRGAQLDAQARGLQAGALSGIGGPSLSLSAFGGRVSNTVNLDTSALGAALNPALESLGAALPGAALPTIPDTLSSTRLHTLGTVGLTAAWPLYAGGRLDAAQDLAAGRAHEAEAERSETEEKLLTQVAQRYFSVQLAREAWALRGAAVAGVAEHQRAARLLEQSGLIARAERLRADVALDNARRDEARARSDLSLAELALRRQLALEAPVQPSTPLFVHSQPVDTLEAFLDAGQRHHPAWAKLASKREQADAALRLQAGAFSPTVLALAHYNLNQSREQTLQPNWQLGVAVSVPLYSRIGHGQMREAARLEQQRVEASAEQAARDIPTLIEAQWRAMDNARLAYLSGESSLALAREHLRLQRAAFAQSQATSTDVTDAELNLAKTAIERRQQAFDYVMALTRLLEASGQAERLPELAERADIRLLPEPTAH